MKRLSNPMKAALLNLRAHNEPCPISTHLQDRWEVTIAALERRELVKLSHTYDESYNEIDAWTLTGEGMRIADDLRIAEVQKLALGLSMGTTVPTGFRATVQLDDDERHVVVFSGGESEHRIALLCSSDKRIKAHWQGYLEAAEIERELEEEEQNDQAAERCWRTWAERTDAAERARTKRDLERLARPAGKVVDANLGNKVAALADAHITRAEALERLERAWATGDAGEVVNALDELHERIERTGDIAAPEAEPEADSFAADLAFDADREDRFFGRSR